MGIYRKIEMKSQRCRVCNLNVLPEEYEAHVERHRGFSERRSRVAEIKTAAKANSLWFGEPAKEVLGRIHIRA